MEMSPDLPVMESEKGIILFRIIQESVNNIIRHSGATSIEFEARNEKGKLVVRISDNGKGFDTNAEAGGMGLRNLASRSKMIDAKIRITSSPGKGTTIILSTN
jgi:signal transduction histidine kinase